jgi:hypothetical protein
MNIYEIDSNISTKLTSTRSVGKDNGFKRVFSQKMDEMNAALPLNSSPRVGEIIKKSEEVLCLLEEYANGLSDPEMSLKDIGPLVERIKEEAGLIEADVNEKGQSDSGLGRIIRELSVVANVEAFKFHRGDYV